MSGNNEDDKTEGSKVFPLDLASKLTVKPLEMSKGTPLVMTAQPYRGLRVLTQATGTSMAGQTISIVPQTIIKPGESLQRTQLTGIISSHGSAQAQSTSGLSVARPTQISLTTSVVGQPTTMNTTTYHVPRGPAVVANLATPRSAVATPIRAAGVATTPPGQSTGFVTSVRQMTPARTPSPLAAGTTWLSSTGLQQAGVVKSVVSTTGTSTVHMLNTANLQRATTRPGTTAKVLTRSAAPAANLVAARQAIAIGQPNTAQIHSFKPGTAQVMPTVTRTQTLLYSGGATPHFSASPRIGALNTTQRQIITATRPAQVMATRLAAVPVSVSQGSTRLTVTPTGQGTIYTTGARISAVPAPQSQQNTIIGTGTARIAVATGQQRLTSVSSGQGALLSSAPARLTVSNSPAQPSAVVIAQAGRLGASVVSLHPMVVGNTQAGRTIIQAQGPKVITQQLTQIPTVAKQQPTVVPVTVATTTSRTINVQPATIVSQRPVTVSGTGSQPIPITKIFSQGNRDSADGTTNNQPTNVYIHAGAAMVRPSNSPITLPVSCADAQRSTPVTTSVATFALSSSVGTTYYYDATSGGATAGAGGYTVQSTSANLRSFSQSSAVNTFTAATRSPSTGTGGLTQVHSIMSGQSIQLNPVMVVEQNRQFMDSTNSAPTALQQQEHNPLPSIGKVTSSPRPSILRKRDNEGSPLKAAKNLAPVLASLSSAPVSPPSRPDSRGANGSSHGSSTLSARSSPGLGDLQDDEACGLPPVTPTRGITAAAVAMKLEHHQDEEKPSQEMSPRKKPRKQQLTGNDLHEPKFNMEEMQFLSDNKKKDPVERHALIQGREVPVPQSPIARAPPNNTEVTVRKPQPASLLNSYRQTWKSTHNHYLRYTDVKPKDERRPTVIDLANQSHVLQKINGWKIYHLSTQMDDLADLETQVYDKLSSVLKVVETKDPGDQDREFNRINELIKGNMQRSKIINDSMVEAKTQVMKIFDHKEHVADIINRCASKRNFKKREKFN